MKKVGEDETNATRYAIAADAISMGFCAASISLGHYAERYGTHRLLCRRGPINSQALNFFKLSLFSVAASIALSFIIFYGKCKCPKSFFWELMGRIMSLPICA